MTRSPSNPPPPTWQLHQAKARFSELFRLVRAQGPQRVVKQGGEAVVIVSAEEFDRLRQRVEQPESLVEFFRQASTGGQVLDVRRKRDATRDIEWPSGCRSRRAPRSRRSPRSVAR